MDVGIHVPSFKFRGGSGKTASELTRLARTAEDAGCDSVSVMDHFFQMEDYFPVEEPMLEGYTTLGFLAAATERVQLRTLVTGVTYRHPGLLAKIVTTLDILSEGRAELGIGAAWYEREHRGLGVAFPSVSERFERLEETLQICLQMWSDDDGAFHGKHFQLAETLCSPRPIARPHPPILIGGGGEKKTLRLVAQYGDACNLFTPSPEEVERKLRVLRQHCADEDRDYDRIRKTILYTGDALNPSTTTAFVDEMARYHEMGIDGVIVMPVGEDASKRVAELGRDVIPKLAEL